MAVYCPKCDKKLNVRDDGAARRARCHGCKQIVSVLARNDRMRCAKCQSHALEALPPNALSAEPGYVCTECDAAMRMTGTTGPLAFCVMLGLLGLLVNLVLLYLLIPQLPGVHRGVTMVAIFTALSVGVSGWGVYKLSTPMPLDAPPSGVATAMWILVPLLLLGGFVFGSLYLLSNWSMKW